MYVLRTMNSFNISFCIVPASSLCLHPLNNNFKEIQFGSSSKIQQSPWSKKVNEMMYSFQIKRNLKPILQNWLLENPNFFQSSTSLVGIQAVYLINASNETHVYLFFGSHNIHGEDRQNGAIHGH